MSSVAERNMKYTLDTQAIERVIPSKDAIALCEKLSRGTIDAGAAVAAIQKKYRLERGGIRG